MKYKIAYKLFRIKKDGNLTSLFINNKVDLKTKRWLKAEFYPTEGFKERFGWHCCPKPNAPHLSLKGRAWYKVKINGYKELAKPKSQGGKWYIARNILILDKV